MRRYLITLLCLAICSSAFPQEAKPSKRNQRGCAAGYATREATTLSMMGWGMGIAVGIAAICGLIPDHDASSSHSH